MVLVQKRPFFQLFFLGNIGQENVFYYILERINAFLSYKNKNLKRPKIYTFPKVLTNGFGLKITIFPTFLFKQYRRGKGLLRYSRTKKTFFQAIKTGTLRSCKINIIAKGVNSWFWSKNYNFSNFSFQPIQSRKMSFTIFQNKKNAFLSYKNKNFKKSKN